MVLVDRNVTASLLERADLSRPIPENVRKLAGTVDYEESRVEMGSHSVFVVEAKPPGTHYAKGSVILLHGQSYSSSTWIDSNVIRTFAALGYRTVAIDLPGSGKTQGPAVEKEEKPNFLKDFIQTIGFKQAIVICASMASQYVFPLMKTDLLSCVVAIAPSNTHQLGDVNQYITPILLVWGERDTSLGPTAASNLKNLPRIKLQKIPDSGHACYLHNTQFFEDVCINFFELVRNYRSAFD